MKLYDNGDSGNAYKVRLMLAHLGVPFERIALDIDNGERRALVESKREPGYKALGVMEGHLAGRSFFVAEQFTIADIALYVYTHVADEGGVDLGDFPAVRGWIARVAGQPGHVLITDD